MKATIGVSNRHVHLTKETWESLFGEKNIEVRNRLNQPGQFAATDTVDLVVGEKRIDGVRIIGPFRSYNQVELNESDAIALNINPPRRQSGDLDNTPGIKIIGPAGEIEINNGVILAERHIHMTSKMANMLGIQDKQLMSVYSEGNYLFDAIVKYSDPGYFEIHIDKDESKQYNLQTGAGVDIRICGK